MVLGDIRNMWAISIEFKLAATLLLMNSPRFLSR